MGTRESRTGNSRTVAHTRGCSASPVLCKSHLTWDGRNGKTSSVWAFPKRAIRVSLPGRISAPKKAGAQE